MKSSIGIILRKQENTITALMRISLKIHGNHVKRNRTCGRRGKYLLPRRRKIGSRPISRSCLIGGGLNPPQGIRNLFLIEFTLCHIPIRDACTWNSWWIETRNALLSRRVFRQPILRFEVDTWSIFEFSTNRNSAAAVCRHVIPNSRSRSFGELLDFFFFKHHEVYGKLCLFYHNFQDSFLSFDPCIINLIQLKYRQFWNIYGIFNNFRKLSNNSWSLDRTSPLFKLLNHFNKIRERERIKDKREDLLFAINNILCKFNFLWPIK